MVEAIDTKIDGLKDDNVKFYQKISEDLVSKVKSQKSNDSKLIEQIIEFFKNIIDNSNKLRDDI